MSYGGGRPGGGRNMTVAEWQEISVDPKLLKKIERMDRNLEAVMERLSVLDTPTAEKLSRHKMLRDAYLKYKFLEKLCDEEDES